MYWLCNWFVKITGILPKLLLMPTKVHYEDKKAQGRHIRGKAIVVSNHNTLMDFAIMLYVFWTRTLRCQMAEVLYRKNFVMTGFLKALGGIRVDRKSADFSFLGKSAKILEKGGVVEVYPEARLPVKGEQTPLPFKPSVIYLALQTGAPIIPVYNQGVYFKGKKNHVMIGKPVDVSEWYDEGLTEKQNLDAMSERLRRKVMDLRDELEKKLQEKKTK